jgi:hypothetical protein
MEQYWFNRPQAAAPAERSDGYITENDVHLTDFDVHRRALITQEENEGWSAELRRYLKDMPATVSKETDIIEWWQVHYFLSLTTTKLELTEYNRTMARPFRRSHG